MYIFQMFETAMEILWDDSSGRELSYISSVTGLYFLIFVLLM